MKQQQGNSIVVAAKYGAANNIAEQIEHNEADGITHHERIYRSACLYRSQWKNLREQRTEAGDIDRKRTVFGNVEQGVGAIQQYGAFLEKKDGKHKHNHVGYEAKMVQFFV